MKSFYEEDPNRFKLILEALSDFDLAITPSGTVEQAKEAEDFWRDLWKQCPPSNPEGQVNWLKEQIPHFFRSLDMPPQWIQGEDWPFAGGKPMIFAGQLDVKRTDSNLAGKFFHDDVSYYIFIPSYDLIDEKRHYPDRLIMQRW